MYSLEFMFFDIKKHKIMYLIPVLFLWCLILPFLINLGENLTSTHNTILYFNYFQKVFPVFILYYLFVFYRNLLNHDAIEVIQSMNSQKKIIYIIYILLLYQIILIPFYIVSLYYFGFTIIGELININMILLFLEVLFYTLSYLFRSPTIAIGIVFIYCFIFITLLPQVTLFNIFHINNPIDLIMKEYYLNYTIGMIVMLVVSHYADRCVV